MGLLNKMHAGFVTSELLALVLSTILLAGILYVCMTRVV